MSLKKICSLHIKPFIVLGLHLLRYKMTFSVQSISNIVLFSSSLIYRRRLIRLTTSCWYHDGVRDLASKVMHCDGSSHIFRIANILFKCMVQDLHQKTYSVVYLRDQSWSPSSTYYTLPTWWHHSNFPSLRRRLPTLYLSQKKTLMKLQQLSPESRPVLEISILGCYATN